MYVILCRKRSMKKLNLLIKNLKKKNKRKINNNNNKSNKPKKPYFNKVIWSFLEITCNHKL